MCFCVCLSVCKCVSIHINRCSLSLCIFCVVCVCVCVRACIDRYLSPSLVCLVLCVCVCVSVSVHQCRVTTSVGGLRPISQTHARSARTDGWTRGSIPLQMRPASSTIFTQNLHFLLKTYLLIEKIGHQTPESFSFENQSGFPRPDFLQLPGASRRGAGRGRGVAFACVIVFVAHSFTVSRWGNHKQAQVRLVPTVNSSVLRRLFHFGKTLVKLA